MPSKSLSPKAMKVLSEYLQLPIPGHAVPCPYFNNKRNKVRAGLRVLLGKGSIEDIIKEIELICLREKIDLDTLSDEGLSKLLVDKHIGIDCSGFVYYVLDAEFKSKGKGPIRKRLSFPYATNPIRKILTKLRPAENTNVKTLAHEKNSTEVTLTEIKPGDMIVMIASKKFSNPDHMLLVHEVDYDEIDKPKTIRYTHSFHWPEDGKYFHGVKQGRIEVTDLHKNIIAQHWIEKNQTEDKNYTYKQATEAETVAIRRTT